MTEPPITLTQEQVQPLLADIDPLAEMRALFTALGQDQASQPPQTLTLLPGGAGDFITYSGILPVQGVFGLKVSPYLKTTGQPIITAWTQLMSLQTGQPLLLCDSHHLTTLRTAATTALAVDLLAPQEAHTLTVIGSGSVALAHLQATLPLRAWTDIRVWSPHLSESPDTQAAFQGLHPSVRLTDRRAALHEAEVIMLCTSSGTPVLDPAELTRPALITSISTNAPQAHEIPPSRLPDLNVYCDYRHTTPDTAGEMMLAQQEGWTPQSVLGDLGELLTGQASLPRPHRHTFFRSVGLGLEDVQMALAVYRAHLRGGHP